MNAFIFPYLVDESIQSMIICTLTWYTEYECISNIKPYAFVNPVDMYLIENVNISKTIEVMTEPADDQKNTIACNFAQNG